MKAISYQTTLEDLLEYIPKSGSSPVIIILVPQQLEKEASSAKVVSTLRVSKASTHKKKDTEKSQPFRKGNRGYNYLIESYSKIPNKEIAIALSVPLVSVCRAVMNLKKRGTIPKDLHSPWDKRLDYEKTKSNNSIVKSSLTKEVVRQPRHIYTEVEDDYIMQTGVTVKEKANHLGLKYYSVYERYWSLKARQVAFGTYKDIVTRPSLSEVTRESLSVSRSIGKEEIGKDLKKIRRSNQELLDPELLKGKHLGIVEVGNPLYHEALGLGQVVKKLENDIWITEFTTKKGVDKYFSYKQCMFLQKSLLKKLGVLEGTVKEPSVV